MHFRTALLAIIFFVGCQSTSPTSQSMADVRNKADHLTRSILEGWNTQDLDRLMSAFASDADVVAADGRYLVGREQIRSYYEENLRGPYAVLRLREPRITSSRHIEGDIYLVDADWKVFSPDSPSPVASPHGTSLLRCRAGSCVIVASRVMFPARVQ